jgi:O-antigen ligase
MSSLAWIIIVAAILILPFFYLEATIDPVMTPRILVLSFVIVISNILLIIGIYRNHKPFDFSIMRRGIVLAMLGYLVFSGISVFKSTCLSEGLFDLQKIIVGFLFFVLVAGLLSSNGKYPGMIIKVVILVGLGLALIAVSQYFELGFTWIPGHHAPNATMVNKNLLASFLFLTMPFALYGVYRYKDFWRIVAACSIMLSLYVILIGQTRAVWAALALSTPLTLLALTAMKRKASAAGILNSRRAIIIIVAVILAFLMAILTLSSAVRDERQTQLFNTSDASFKQRLLLWDKSVRMYIDNPMLGTGLSDWKIVLPEYGTEGLPSESGVVLFQRPHNDFLWVLSECGMPGLLCYLMIFGLGLYYCIRIIKNAKQEKDVVMALCLFFGIAGFAVISFFSYPKERIAHEAYFMLMLAMITSRSHNLFPLKRKAASRRGKLTLPVFIVCSLLCVMFGAYRLKAEVYTKRAVQAISRQDWKSALEEIDKAKSIFVDLDPTATPLLWYKGAALYMNGDKTGALESYLKAYEHNPNHVQLLNNLASCYEESGNHAEALALYEKALSIAPGFEKTLINLAAVYYNLGEYPKAYDALMQIEGRPTDPRYESFLEAIKAKLSPAGNR